MHERSGDDDLIRVLSVAMRQAGAASQHMHERSGHAATTRVPGAALRQCAPKGAGAPTAMLNAKKSRMPTEKSSPAQSVTASVSCSNAWPSSFLSGTAFSRKPCAPRASGSPNAF